MELVKRDQGNVRSKSWYEFTEKFCKDNGEDIEDLLSFNLRRVMLQRGKKAKADTLEKLLTDKQTSLDPLSPGRLGPGKFAPKEVSTSTKMIGNLENRRKDKFLPHQTKLRLKSLESPRRM